MDWFEQLVGFVEESTDQVRANLYWEGGILYSRVNGAAYGTGQLSMPSLQQLRMEVDTGAFRQNKVREVIGGVQDLHVLPENKGALVQVASQFNLLEMVGPQITPEQGVSRYAWDHTQGPACAIACGAATIYRNYFVEVNGQTGQTKNNQIDCLAEIGAHFHNAEKQYWVMQNGYALPGKSGLDELSAQIDSLNPEAYEALKGLLAVGIQQDAQVTIAEQPQQLSQVFCSALPVSYAPGNWESFARLILDALYEATLLAAIANRDRTDNNKVYLTLVGGGAFGNRSDWIIDAVVKNLKKYAANDLDIRFVSYGQANPTVASIINSLK